MNIHEMAAPWALELAGCFLQSSPNEGHDGLIGDLDLCGGGNLSAPTVRIWTGDEGWKEIPLATRFLSGEWHPDMEALSPAGSREAAFFAHGAAFPVVGNSGIEPAEALSRLMSGEWDATAVVPAAQPGNLVRVDRDGNLLADPCGFGTWKNFEAAVDAAGLELDQHPGTDAEGWRVVAVSPRTGPNRPEGEDGPPPEPDPALERVWIE
jgi:hypothetical protein